MQHKCHVRWMAYIPFQANANYWTWSIDFDRKYTEVPRIFFWVQNCPLFLRNCGHRMSFIIILFVAWPMISKLDRKSCPWQFKGSGGLRRERTQFKGSGGLRRERSQFKGSGGLRREKTQFILCLLFSAQIILIRINPIKIRCSDKSCFT